MWATIASAILGPAFQTALKAYQAKLAAGNTTDQIAADLAARELSVQQTEVQVQAALKTAQIGHWSEPEHLFAYITLIYYGKCLLWDKVLDLGSTDPLRGDISLWAGMIMSFWFSKRLVENAIRLARRQP